MALTGFITLLLTWILPLILIVESPKWLYVNGYFSRYLKTTTIISKINKTNFEKRHFVNLFIDADSKDHELLEELKTVKIHDTTQAKMSSFTMLFEIFLNKMYFL